MIDKSKLKELALAATPGPWVANGICIENDTTGYGVAETRSYHSQNDALQARNGAYIAAANPTAILKLLAELESARNAALEEAAKAVERKCEEADLTYKKGILLDAACGIRALATTTSTEPAKEAATNVMPPVEIELPDGDERTVKVRWDEMKDGKRHVCISVESPPVATPVSQHDSCPAVLFDGKAVYDEVMRIAPCKTRTSPENVAEVLDAAVSLIRQSQATYQSNMAGAARQGGVTSDNIGSTPAPSASASPADYQLTLDAVQAAMGDSYDPERGLAMSVFVLKKAFDAEAKLGETYKQIALAAPVAGSQHVPEGCVIVPKFMNAAMINAWSGGTSVTSDNVAARTTFQDAWKRVLAAAAPAVPVTADQDHARDAARYRWLRHMVWDSTCFRNEGHMKIGEELDAAVDAAMASLQQGKEGA